MKLPKPRGTQIIVEPEEIEDRSRGGLFIPQVAQAAMQKSSMRGTVRSIGPDVEELPSGSVVLYSKYSGVEFEEDEKKYLLMSVDDILAVY